MVGVFRYHGPTLSNCVGGGKILRKRKRGIAVGEVLVGADLAFITFKDCTKSIEEFRDCLPASYLTLTRREADLISLANPGVLPPLAIEDLYPWLPDVLFLNDSRKSFEILSHYIQKFGSKLDRATIYCNSKWGTICNSIGIKAVADARYYSAWHLPVQDVFVLEDRRPQRSVVVIDFNSMYPSCMQQEFPDPKSMHVMSCNRFVGYKETLPVGLYRCLLSGPTSEFINKYNPFRTFFMGRRLGVSLDEDIEVDLNEFEVSFFQNHFKSIFLESAVVSRKTISHPLAREAVRSFARRRNYNRQGNAPLANREKYLSTLLASCSSRPTVMKKLFRSKSDADEYILCEYGISKFKGEPIYASESWLRGGRGVSVKEVSSGFLVEGPNLTDGSACFSLGQRIVARARVVLLAKMEAIFTSIEGVEICYTNIDSIHFSIPNSKLSNVLEELSESASDAMGSFKIECVADHGLWLEPGRYWLYGEKIEKFKNRSIGSRFGAFKDYSTYVSVRKISDLYIPIKSSVGMNKSMSYTRSLQRQKSKDIVLQNIILVKASTEFTDVLNQLEENKKHSIPQRMNAFLSLKNRMERLGFSSRAASRLEKSLD
ncbi:hypothetical protein KBW81_12855 [Loktanella salsilacus]|uniref:hypothetical protein n=1 Tax=Loktanella salsilacus TaxID=195913 RepID=UPI0020B86409|nr:hypothetical protein [Loktanella salsilacus]UTH47595.1 hypothetical protein KBW81_12855 [Loktanella salsilacus]